MKKVLLFLLFFSSCFFIFSKTASVNIKFLFFTSPEFKNFDFNDGYFKSVEDMLNRDKEEFSAYEKLYTKLMEQKSLISRKMVKDLKSAKKNKLSKSKVKRMQKKFDNTILRISKKMKSIEHKLDSFTKRKDFNLVEKAKRINYEKLNSILKKILITVKTYSIKHGYSEVIDTSPWRRGISKFNTKYKLFPSFSNSYLQFIKTQQKKYLDHWLSEGVMSVSKKMMWNSDFILYGGKDITFKIFDLLRKNSLKK